MARSDIHWTGLEASLSYLPHLREKLRTAAILDIEDLPRLPPRQDVVLAADVLEHFYDTERMLQLVHDALLPGGHLYLSVPNIANIYVRLNLLGGRFPYSDRGILDRTHRVFFTRRSISDLLQQGGFTIERRAVSTIPLPLAFPRLPPAMVESLSWLLEKVTPLWPTLLGYQLLFLARRR